jgi:ABC-type Fe3+-hydroxamate transport system substrate-binding protein/adenosylcobinamide amidohydrolase
MEASAGKKWTSPMTAVEKGLLRRVCTFAVITVLVLASSAGATQFEDGRGQFIQLDHPPQRIVSLVPAVTEILFEIGAGDRIVGVTYHDSQPEAVQKLVVGGFFSPSIDKILAVNPDAVMVSSLHQSVIEQCAALGIPTLRLDTSTLDGSFDTMAILGRLVGREAAADELRAAIRRQFDHIRRKVEAIPPGDRLRTMRLMGRDRVMTPGDDSFQNEMIAAAGGTPPSFGKTGPVVEIGLAQWRQFNPQVVYGCYGEEEAARRFLNRTGWKDVAAVRDGRIYHFPCALTCRAGAHTGDFVAWLSARLYSRHFSKPELMTAPDEVLSRRPLAVALPYVKEAAVVHSRIFDFNHKTLLVTFTDPMTVVSTLDGVRDGVTAAGNHFYPPPAWSIGHESGLDGLHTTVCGVLQRPNQQTALLFTGADMDNLSIQCKTYRDISVYALVTAGARINAVRSAMDVGRYYEPGTINVVLMTNAALTPRALQRAVITATEAKTAALQDLDIRSSYTPQMNGATGTGTDNIVVVQGSGVRIDNSGGHTRMGALIGRAVYAGVREALFRQDGVASGRSILQRLKERKISIRRLFRQEECPCGLKPHEFAAAVERVLLEPRHASFMEAAFAISDHYEQGLVNDLSSFRSWARTAAQQIAGTPIGKLDTLIDPAGLPVVLFEALNATANGVRCRKEKPQE